MKEKISVYVYLTPINKRLEIKVCCAAIRHKRPFSILNTDYWLYIKNKEINDQGIVRELALTDWPRNRDRDQDRTIRKFGLTVNRTVPDLEIYAPSESENDFVHFSVSLSLSVRSEKCY